MKREHMATVSRLSVFAAAGIFLGGYATTPATAADLGGDCCADLEERVAELEATTVRKKARQLSMTISGRVHSAIMHWDDGGGWQRQLTIAIAMTVSCSGSGGFPCHH